MTELGVMEVVHPKMDIAERTATAMLVDDVVTFGSHW